MHYSVRERRGRERLTAMREKGKERGNGVDQRARVSKRNEVENGEGRKEKKKRRKFGDRVKKKRKLRLKGL